jgi:hypothetical protein
LRSFENHPIFICNAAILGAWQMNHLIFNLFFVCLFVYSRQSNFSAIWRLSPLPVTGPQI